MFGIDDALLGAAVGGVTGLASTWWTNEKADERQADAQAFFCSTVRCSLSDAG